MEISNEMMNHYGVKSQDEFDDLLITDPESYHQKTNEWYQKQADLKLQEKSNAEIKTKIEKSGYSAEEINNFAKEMGASTITDKLIDSYSKLNPRETKEADSVTSSHQKRETPSTIDSGKRASSEPEKTISKLIQIKGQLQ